MRQQVGRRSCPSKTCVTADGVEAVTSQGTQGTIKALSRLPARVPDLGIDVSVTAPRMWRTSRARPGTGPRESLDSRRMTADTSPGGKHAMAFVRRRALAAGTTAGDHEDHGTSTVTIRRFAEGAGRPFSSGPSL
jgi:hypothetical protein